MNTPAAGRREVIQRELAWHEHEAGRRLPLDKFLYEPPAFDTIVNAALDFLDGRPGELVLDMGCGEGKETVAIAARGWRVIGLDLSLVQLSRARQAVSALKTDYPVYFVQANAEQLPFADRCFRIIHGKAVIHHLDLVHASGEIQRALAEDGRAAIAEPLAHHPLFWLGRRLTPSMRTADEHPLTYAEINQFAGTFAGGEVSAVYLFTPLAYFFRLSPRGETLFRRAYRTLMRLDTWLLRHISFLRPFAWYGALKLWKRKTS